MLPPRKPSQIKRHTQTKRDGKRYFVQMERKTSWGSSTYIQQNRLKAKTIVRNKEGHYIMIKGTIQQESITPVNIYTHNVEAPKYVKQILVDIKGKTDRNTVIVRDFNTSLTSMDRSSRQNISKETAALNNTQ